MKMTIKKTISLLFATLLTSFFIVGCGGSSGGGDSDNNNNNAGTVNVPGSSTEQSTALKPKDTTTKPKVTPACDTGKLVPGCS